MAHWPERRHLQDGPFGGLPWGCWGSIVSIVIDVIVSIVMGMLVSIDIYSNLIDVGIYPAW